MTLFVRIKPNQRFNKLEKINEEWHIRLKAPAVDGKANDRLIVFLAELLEIPKADITLKRGHRSRMKYLEIEEESDIVERKLKAKLNE